MSDKNNPQSALSEITDNRKPSLYAGQLETIKSTMTNSIKELAEQSKPKTSPTIFVKVLNDDFLGFINKKNDFGDGGMVTSQLQAGVSFPQTKGLLKNGDITLHASAKTSTAWGNTDQITPTKDENKSEANPDETKPPTPVKPRLPVYDGRQLPTSESYMIGVSAFKPVALKENQTLDINSKIEIGYISGHPAIQDMWHNNGGATYLRSQTNQAKSQVLMNTELTAALRNVKHTGTTLKETTYLSGVTLGTDHVGAMAGIKYSIGSTGSHYFPETSDSALFGNTNSDHTVQGGLAKAKDWKITGYIKTYLSSPSDARTTLSKKVKEPPQTGVATFTTDTLTDIPKTYPYQSGGNEIKYGQGYEVAHEKKELAYSVPTAITGYRFKPLNAELGIKAQYQLTSQINVNARVAYLTNPAQPQINPGYQQELDKIRDFYLGLPHVSTDHNKDPEKFSQRQEYVTESFANSLLKSQDIKDTFAQKSPFGNAFAEVGVNIALGSGKKKNSSPSK